VRKERTWLRPLLTPWVRRVCLAGFAASFFFPITGLGVDLCPIHAVSGLPCPGCGVTRGIALVSHGEPLTALGAHPFILFLWPGLLILAIAGLFPQRVVDAAESRLDLLEPAFSSSWKILLAAFFGFGVLRFFAFLVMGEHFP
jgi:hypothetical protein